MARKKTAGKAVLSMKDLDKQMLADASDASARTAQSGGNTIGIRNSKFSYKNEPLGKVFTCVVVNYVHANAYYDTAFDPENPAPPACVAISEDGDEMEPVKGSPTPQNPTCDGCEHNAWGSADVGRGKACAEQYKLAVVAVGPGEDYSTCDMAILTLPPTSRQNWTKYVKDISEKLQRPPYGVLTEFSFSDGDYPILVPEFAKKIGTAKDLNDIVDRRSEALDMLTTPPDFSGFVPPTRKKASKKKAAKKKTAKKKTAKKASKKKAKKKTSKKTGSKFS